MYYGTSNFAEASAYPKYVSETARAVAEPKQWVPVCLFKAMTAAFTVVSSLTVVQAGTLSISAAAISEFSSPLMLWRTSRASLSEAEIASLVRKLDRLKKYKAGWAGPGSVTPTRVSANAAVDFIHYISEVGLTAPTKINLSSDGEINFYWNTKRATLNVGIDRRAKLAYYARLPNGTEFVQDGKKGVPSLNADLIGALSST